MTLYARQHGVSIQHNMNGAEKRIGSKKAKVDGYIAETDTVIEFQVRMKFALCIEGYQIINFSTIFISHFSSGMLLARLFL